MRKHIFLLLCLFPALASLQAQETLSLDEAIRQALENNYGIRIAQYDVVSSENDVFRGNAGQLPSLSLQGGANYNLNNSEVDLVSGTDPATGQPIITRQSANGIETSNANLSLNLNWTVFNGLTRANNYKILIASADLTKEQTRSLVEQQVLQVASAYYQLARLENTYQIQQEALRRSQQRLAFVQNQAEFGSSTQLAILNAQVDVNTDSVNLATTAINLDNARRNLNFLMGAELSEDMAVDRSVALSEAPGLPELENLTRQNNASLQTAAQAQKISELNLRVAEGNRLPTLSLNSSYGLNYSDNGPFSFAPQIFSYGLSAGISLSVPIYNGSQINRGIQRAEIGLAQSNMQRRQTEQQVLRDLQNAYYTYLNNLQVLRLQETSVAAAQENFARTQERFELGQATSVQFREAQLNLLNAENRLNDLRYDAKLSELNLIQITGSLVPQE